MSARTFSSLPPRWISRRNSKQKGSTRWTRHSGGTTTVTASTVNNLGTQLKGTSRAPTTLTFINKPRMDERRSEKWLVGSSRESVKERERERERKRGDWWCGGIARASRRFQLKCRHHRIAAVGVGVGVGVARVMCTTCRPTRTNVATRLSAFSSSSPRPF